MNSQPPALHRLLSITLGIHPKQGKSKATFNDWHDQSLSLLSSAPLHRFQIYSSDGAFCPSFGDELWQTFVHDHGSRLVRFSVHRMLLSFDVIQAICLGCVALEEFFVVAHRRDLVRLCHWVFQDANNPLGDTLSVSLYGSETAQCAC